ncbi:MAG: ECF transporter S component [Chloroflexota bacterium]|nr:ECF transporter S component [Chloroflexota bacterium]
MKKSRLFLALIFVTGIAAVVIPMISPNSSSALMNWGLIATTVVILAIMAFFFEFEAAAISSKEIALIAMLGTISAVLRIPFAALPSVQPSTYLIICSGYVFGPVAGFMVGALTALVSNFFLGQGPWTPYQMLAWGLIGVCAAYLRRFNLGRVWLVVFGIVGAYLYGWLVNTWYWVSFIYPLSFKTFLVYQLNSIWLDTFHAIGNALFLGLFGMKTISILERFRRRFNWRLSSTQSLSIPPEVQSGNEA